MNKLPLLKEFLKGGEAECYKNVEIKYVMGKPPTLSIYHSGKFHEKVNLKEYSTTSTSSSTKKKLHDLFQEKGLELKSNEEIIAIKKAKDVEEELRRQLEEETNRKWEEKKRQKEKMIQEEIQRQKELYGHSVLEEEIKAGRKVDHRKSSKRLQEGQESSSDDETNPTSTYYSSPTPPGAKRLVDFMDDEEKMRDKRRKEQREMQEKMREEYLKKTAEMNEQRQLEKERRRGAERRRNLEQLELLVDGMAPKEEQQATLLKERKMDDEDRGDESIKKGDRTRESARGTDHQKQTGMEL